MRATTGSGGEPSPDDERSSDVPDELPWTEPRPLIVRPEQCTVAVPGALLTIRRAMFTGAHALDTCRAIERTAQGSPQGKLVLLQIFRLCSEFPLPPHVDGNLRELAAVLRRVAPVVAASADVLEFGGVRAVVMRGATRTVWALARLGTPRSSFDRLTDAVEWLIPHARSIGAPDEPAPYVRLFRAARAELDEADARRELARRGERR